MLQAAGWDNDSHSIAEQRQFTDRVKQQQAAFFNYYAPEARETLNGLAGNHDSRKRTTHVGASNSWQRWERQYARDGELQFTLPDVLKVPPISQRGNVNEIIRKFGGADQLRVVKFADYNAKKVRTFCANLPSLPSAATQPGNTLCMITSLNI
ncbi:MAG: hypothetical protein AB1705_18175 [Verrucomicrobiota bacterium]